MKGYNELKKQLRDLENVVENDIKEVLKKGANDILQRALSRVPVDKGILKSSGGIEETDNGWVFKVYFSAKYAPYQEFGTGALTEVPLGLEDYAMEFFVSGKGFTPAQPFLFPAFFDFRDAIVKEVNDLLNRATK